MMKKVIRKRPPKNLKIAGSYVDKKTGELVCIYKPYYIIEVRLPNAKL